MITDSSLNTVFQDEENLGAPQWSELAGAASASALHAQMPDVKHTTVSTRPGEGAAAFIVMLEKMYGKKAVEIPDNLALRITTLLIWGAGNDLCYTEGKNRFERYYNNQTLPDKIRADYKLLERYAMTFGSSIWMGIENEDLYYHVKQWWSEQGSI